MAGLGPDPVGNLYSAERIRLGSVRLNFTGFADRLPVLHRVAAMNAKTANATKVRLFRIRLKISDVVILQAMTADISGWKSFAKSTDGR